MIGVLFSLEIIMGQKPLTGRQYERLRTERPVVDTYISAKGDVVGIITGVRKPFEVQISRKTLIDDAPFGRPTPESILRTVHHVAQFECVKRGLV